MQDKILEKIMKHKKPSKITDGKHRQKIPNRNIKDEKDIPSTKQSQATKKTF